MKSKERKLLESFELVIIGIFIASVMGIAFETFRLFTGEQTKFRYLILWAVAFGLALITETFIGLAKEKLRNYETIYERKASQIMRERFKEDKEKFLAQFKEAMHEAGHPITNDLNNGEPEIIIDKVEKDNFAGDPVYDNLDNLFGYTKRVVDGEKPEASRNFIDAEFTVVSSTRSVGIEDDLASFTVAELKDMCKANGITGYSAMRKAELIEVLENYNRAQK